MDEFCNKPKLVFFQYTYDPNLPEFLLNHKREHVRCLSEFFEVTVIDQDCDYQQICDQYQPDLTLFETGLNLLTCHKLKIINIHGCAEIPKLGLHNSDAWCETRAGILSDMERWGIETSFSISTTAAEHTPEIAERLFIWPNFIDAELYRDYREFKNIPVLFTGAQVAQYPWRRRIYKFVSEHYPSLICPHLGYHGKSAPAQTIYGEQYARTINASRFVPACGTVAKEVVRKHFEVPGCKACLITEKSPGLEAAGFIDMKNCVFADQYDIADKLDYLFRNPEELAQITEAGYQLVHARHTMKERDQILQWFKLYKNLQNNQRIVQLSPFEPLIVVEQSSESRNYHAKSNGLHLKLLHQGDERLWAGKYDEAETLYLRCSNYMRMMPEPKFRLGLCSLYKGNAKMATHFIFGPIRYTLDGYKSVDPDPVEWAYYSVSFLCQGKLVEAIKRAGEFPWLRHPELDRTRWVLDLLRTNRSIAPLIAEGKARHRPSIHQLPSRSLDRWVQELCTILKACRQFALAERLTKYLGAEGASRQEGQAHPEGKEEESVKEKGDIQYDRAMKSALPLGKINSAAFFKRVFFSKVRQKLADLLLRFAHRLETRFGYFLPYAISEMRNDEFFQAIENLPREEDIETALVIGAAAGAGATEALWAGMRASRKKCSLFYVNGPSSRFVKLEKNFANNPGVRCYRTVCSSGEHPASGLGSAVRRVKQENGIKAFDAVIIDSSELSKTVIRDAGVNSELGGVRFVLLDDINALYNYENHSTLLDDPHYVLAAQNLEWRHGYSIFKRCSAEMFAESSAHLQWSNRFESKCNAEERDWKTSAGTESTSAVDGRRI